MPRRPATITQADLARALRAAKSAGLAVAEVRLTEDGATIIIGTKSDLEPADCEVERKPVPVL